MPYLSGCIIFLEAERDEWQKLNFCFLISLIKLTGWLQSFILYVMIGLLFSCVGFYFFTCFNKGTRDGVCLMVFYLVCQWARYSLLGPVGLLNASRDKA